jgi:transcriptional regulator with XRE-family HTH domain
MTIMHDQSKLSSWLQAELNKRGWSQSELARRASLSSATVSDILGERTNPRLDFCVGVAHAIGIRPEVVLRKAGLLPPLSEADETQEEINYLWQQLSDEEQELELVFLRSIMLRKKAKSPRTAPSTS